MDIITLQNVAQIAELGTLQHGEGKVYSLAFSPDSRFLALGKSGNIELWQLSNRTLKGVLPFRLSVTEDIPFYPIADGVVFHPTGNYVVGVSGNTPRFSIWNVNDLRLEKEVTIPIGHQPRCVAITSSGKTIATGGMDGRVIFWDWNNNNPSLRSYLHAHDALSGDYAMIHSIEFSPDGLFMAIGCSNGEMRVWRVGFDLLYDIHTKMC